MVSLCIVLPGNGEDELLSTLLDVAASASKIQLDREAGSYCSALLLYCCIVFVVSRVLVFILEAVPGVPFEPGPVARGSARILKPPICAHKGVRGRGCPGVAYADSDRCARHVGRTQVLDVSAIVPTTCEQIPWHNFDIASFLAAAAAADDREDAAIAAAASASELSARQYDPVEPARKRPATEAVLLTAGWLLLTVLFAFFCSGGRCSIGR